MKRLFLCFIIGSLAETSVAVLGAEPRCTELFSIVYRAKYVPDHCENNIWHLVDEFHRGGKDLSKARVLFLYIPGETILTLQSREGWKEWKYHVVLEKEGEIYDFDFKDHLRVTKRQDYFTTMFKTENPQWGASAIWGKLRVRSIPAEEYLPAAVQGPKGSTIDAQSYLRSEAKHPSETLLDYLNVHSK